MTCRNLHVKTRVEQQIVQLSRRLFDFDDDDDNDDIDSLGNTTIQEYGKTQDTSSNHF